MKRGGLARLAAAALAWPALAHGHSFGKLYNLPVPFWMYVWGAAGALLVSFLVVGWFVTRPADTAAPASREIGIGALRRWLHRVRALPVARGVTLALLALCVATGLFGTRNPYLNFNMTFFWIVFVLGFTYACALIGDWYAVLNPWRTITAGFGGRVARAFAGRRPYPAAWGVWPALLLYFAFIWIELFGRVKPFSLAVMLLAYTALTLAGAWLFGAAAWLRHGEFFAVFLRLVGRMAPLAIEPASTPGAPLRLRWRMPFAGLLESQATSRSEVLFVLFMLSSTAYDGLHATSPWSRLYWVDVYRLLQPWVGTNIVQAYPTLLKINLAWETTALLLSPFAYLAAYGLALWLAKRMTGSPLSVHALSLRFAYSLLPIALVYNVTHYWTLIVTQGTQIVRIASDPFGWGWNLFGTALFLPLPIIPDMGIVWHTQVGLILFGHVVSVVIAHLEALRVFGGDRRRATISQLPMLALMVLFTTVGLWILAQPIQGGR